MKLIKSPISLAELKKMAEKRFGDMIKAVVDTQKEIMAVDAELHADEEALLLEKGSEQNDLWGINIYPDLNKNEQIEFDSMINIRPAMSNKSRFVEDKETRTRIAEIVRKLIK